MFLRQELWAAEIGFGTIQLGLVISDRKGNIRTLVNKDRGLNNNTVLSLEVDDEGNIWAGLDNGIARIAYNSTISFCRATTISVPAMLPLFQMSMFFGDKPGCILWIGMICRSDERSQSFQAH